MESARLVIIGAGIVGQSIAYHLAKLGWRDMIVLDQGPLPMAGGSTSHAPGLIFQTNSSKFMTSLARYSVDLYSNLSFKGKVGAIKVGGVELARTPQRLAELTRRSGLGKAWGLTTHLLSPNECEDMFPFIDKSKILGGYFVPDDSLADAGTICQAFSETTTELKAAEFRPNVKVIGINRQHNRVKSVVTDQGTINCEMIVCCAGIWGPIIGKMVDFSLPLYPMEHQYLISEPLDALQAWKGNERSLKIIRDQDSRLYFRGHGDCLGIGNYCHKPLPLNPENILSFKESKLMPSVRDFTEEDFTDAYQLASELFPMLKRASFPYKINGMFSFTPDGGPLLGELPNLKGFWVAEAIWVTHAGGIGKLMAEWMHAGYPQEDVHEGEILRFHDFARTGQYIRKRAMTNYLEVYDIIHPKQQRQELRNIRLSPVHQRLVELGAVFFESNGYERPQWFASNKNKFSINQFPLRQNQEWASRFWSPIEGIESYATRNHVGLFDLSAFCIFEVSGNHALTFLNHLSTSKMDVAIGKIVYTNWLDDRGNTVADITISRISEDSFWVVSGNSTGRRDLAWLKAHLPLDGSVQIKDLSDSYATLGLWGPNARNLLQEICTDDISHQGFKYFTYKDLEIEEIPVRAFRVSYVGELGWELYVKSEMAQTLWDKIWQAGQAYHITPAGGQAFDSLRIEKGYRFWGQDMDANHNPLEADLGFIVHWQKNSFKGKKALERQKNTKLEKKLCSIILDNQESVLLGKEPILVNNKVVGYITSAGYSYSINRFIALGWIKVPYYEAGTRIQIEYLGQIFEASVFDGAIFDPEGKKIRC